MIDYLRRVRLTWRQLSVIALLSAVATALVIASAIGQPSTPSAVIAALSRRVVVQRHVTSAVTGVTDPSPASSSPSTTGGNGAASSGSNGSGSGASAAATTSGSGTGSGSGSTTGSTSGPTTKTPTARTYKVKHVFVIALSAPSYAAAFGHGSVATYLNRELKPKGTVLSGYETLGGAELPDYLAMISGQGPNPDTRRDCVSFNDFPAAAKPDAKGLVPGSGCVYPNTVLTVGDQVTAAGADWKAYIGDMGKNACVHPDSGALDNQTLPSAGPQYDIRHNPFIYFHSLLDLGDCSADDLSLSALPAALKSAAKTPRYAFLAPGACADAASGPCPGGTANGLAAEDAFLKSWIPKITASAAYRASGTLIITFATAAPTATPAVTVGTAPERVGALVLSPFAKAGTTITTRYNAYSVLRSTEDLLGLKALGHAVKAKAFVSSALPGA